jgi:MutS domain V
VTTTVDPTTSPLDHYRRRLAARQVAARALVARDNAISVGRLVAFLATGILALLVWRTAEAGARWIALPSALFVGLVLVHDRVIRGRRRAEGATRLYENGIARAEDRWAEGDGRSARFEERAHPYAADLDLFGRGSLFERLSVARTSMGEETLAAWLNTPAPVAVIRDRQHAIEELRPALDLREDVALLGMDVRAEVHPQALGAWASAAPLPCPVAATLGLGGARALAALLGAANLVALWSWLAGHSGPLMALGALLLASAYARSLRVSVQPVLIGVDKRAGELKILALLLQRLERERFQTRALIALRAELDTSLGGGAPHITASRRIARLSLLVSMVEMRRNQIFAVVGWSSLWTTQLALAIEQWRREFGPAVARWLSAVGEVEALMSLATYAFDHPDYPFPTLAEKGPIFEADAIGHPMLPASKRVPNDVTLGAGDGDRPFPHLLVISGSNMSGKSTLLRTVGINAVLALAGAPVCAQRLTISRLAIGASMRLNDSLQGGRSRFFAEITRLRQIVELAAGPTPVLFLLDELLSGTNSHDRRIGAQAVVRKLLDSGAIGLATTHDLALTEIAVELGDLADNVHFEDHLNGETIGFDFQMRPGVVRKSNALALMRAIGLLVSEPGKH